MIQNTLYFQNAICRFGASQKKKLKNKSVLYMKFAKWQIKIKKHDLGHTVSWKYNAHGEPYWREVVLVLSSRRTINFPNKGI